MFVKKTPQYMCACFTIILIYNSSDTHSRVKFIDSIIRGRHKLTCYESRELYVQASVRLVHLLSGMSSVSSTRVSPLHRDIQGQVELSAPQERSRRDELRRGARRGYSSAPTADEESQHRPAQRSRVEDRQQVAISPEEQIMEDFITRMEDSLSNCRRLMTASTLLLVIQGGLLGYILITDGFAPTVVNMTGGPSAYTLVNSLRALLCAAVLTLHSCGFAGGLRSQASRSDRV